MADKGEEVVEQEGELFSPSWNFTWVETGAEIAAGSIIAPITLPESPETIEHASLSLAVDDLMLADRSKIGQRRR